VHTGFEKTRTVLSARSRREQYASGLCMHMSCHVIYMCWQEVLSQAAVAAHGLYNILIVSPLDRSATGSFDKAK